MSWCDCSTDEGGGAEFYRASMRSARIEHRCCECNGAIQPGEQYEHVMGKWEGQVDSFKTCAMCLNIRQHFCPTGWLHGGLDEALSGTIGQSLDQIRDIWIMPGKDRTIAMLVELVCELLETQETREEAQD